MLHLTCWCMLFFSQNDLHDTVTRSQGHHSTNFCGCSKAQALDGWEAGWHPGERGSTMSLDELQETLAVLDG